MRVTVTDLAIGRVSPFGHPGITARLQLPQAYRSLPRPSSPLDAKASTVCLIAFDLKFDLRRTTCAARHSLRQTSRSSPPHGVDSSHPICRLPDRSSSIHRLSKSRADPAGPAKRSECELERDGVRATSETLSPPPRRPALTRDLQKGGDPAAGSPTATLLRLRPSH